MVFVGCVVDVVYVVVVVVTSSPSSSALERCQNISMAPTRSKSPPLIKDFSPVVTPSSSVPSRLVVAVVDGLRRRPSVRAHRLRSAFVDLVGVVATVVAAP